SLELFVILVCRWNCGIGCREAMGMHLAVDIPQVVRSHQWHMTRDALFGLRRIIKGAGPLTRNPAGLPIVVVVEPTQPTITIDRHIKMDFRAGRTQLCCIWAVKRF